MTAARCNFIPTKREDWSELGNGGKMEGGGFGGGSGEELGQVIPRVGKEGNKIWSSPSGTSYNTDDDNRQARVGNKVERAQTRTIDL